MLSDTICFPTLQLPVFKGLKRIKTDMKRSFQRSIQHGGKTQESLLSVRSFFTIVHNLDSIDFLFVLAWVELDGSSNQGQNRKGKETAKNLFWMSL